MNIVFFIFIFHFLKLEKKISSFFKTNIRFFLLLTTSSLLGVLSSLILLLSFKSRNLRGIHPFFGIGVLDDRHSSHQRSERLGDDDTLLGLVVFADAAHDAGERAEGGVEHVRVLLDVDAGGAADVGAVAAVEGARLVVGAV